MIVNCRYLLIFILTASLGSQGALAADSLMMQKGEYSIPAKALLDEHTSFRGTRDDYRFYFSDPTYNPFDLSLPANALNLIASVKGQMELATALNMIGSAVFLSEQIQATVRKGAKKRSYRKDDPNAKLEPVLIQPTHSEMIAVLNQAIKSPYLTQHMPGLHLFEADPRRDTVSDAVSGYYHRDNAAEEFVRLLIDLVSLKKDGLRSEWVQHFVWRLLDKPLLSPSVLGKILGLHAEKTIRLRHRDFLRILHLSRERVGHSTAGKNKNGLNINLAVAQTLHENPADLHLSERLEILCEAMIRDRELLPSGEFINNQYAEIYRSDVLALASQPNKAILQAKYFYAMAKRSYMAKTFDKVIR